MKLRSYCHIPPSMPSMTKCCTNQTTLDSLTQQSGSISKASAPKKSWTGCMPVSWWPTMPLQMNSSKVYALRSRTLDIMSTPTQFKPLSSQKLAGCSTPTNTLICAISKNFWSSSCSDLTPMAHLLFLAFSLKIYGMVPKHPRPPSLP